MSSKDVQLAAELSPADASVAALAVLDGRRRPGRPGQVSPHLVQLLRDPAAVEPPLALPSIVDEHAFGDGLSIARGVGVGLVLAVPVWAAIGLATWAVLR